MLGGLSTGQYQLNKGRVVNSFEVIPESHAQVSTIVGSEDLHFSCVAFGLNFFLIK